MIRAPGRAQRIRGVPGVGLRTLDGREWVRWGTGHRWNPDCVDPPSGPGWVIARCACAHGCYERLDPDEADAWTDLGLRWEVYADCGTVDMDTFTVQSCTRPGPYGNPWYPTRDQSGTWCTTDGVTTRPVCSRGAALVEAIRQYVNECIPRHGTNAELKWFYTLAAHDYLSCWCQFDQPCHVDAIIDEGRTRGIWE